MFWQGRSGQPFGIGDISAHRFHGRSRVEVSFRIKQGIAHAVKRKTAARALLGFGFCAIAIDDAAYAKLLLIAMMLLNFQDSIKVLAS